MSISQEPKLENSVQFSIHLYYISELNRDEPGLQGNALQAVMGYHLTCNA